VGYQNRKKQKKDGFSVVKEDTNSTFGFISFSFQTSLLTYWGVKFILLAVDLKTETERQKILREH